MEVLEVFRRFLGALSLEVGMVSWTTMLLAGE
jgi:hypothetical protein